MKGRLHPRKGQTKKRKKGHNLVILDMGRSGLLSKVHTSERPIRAPSKKILGREILLFFTDNFRLLYTHQKGHRMHFNAAKCAFQYPQIIFFWGSGTALKPTGDTILPIYATPTLSAPAFLALEAGSNLVNRIT